MNNAERKTCESIESVLSGNKAYRKVEDKLYVVKQGSSYVMINVVPWGEERAIVRCVAQLVKGVQHESRGWRCSCCTSTRSCASAPSPTSKRGPGALSALDPGRRDPRLRGAAWPRSATWR